MRHGTSVPVRSTRTLYLGILALLAAAFMVYQIALLRELRFQLTTLFTLTPFLFSTVVFCIALGSLAASRLSSGTLETLRWGAAILPLVLIFSFAMTLRIAQAFVMRDPGRFVVRAEGGLPGGGDAYLTSTLIAFIAVAAAGYGVVFFMQGLIFSLYFREGRNEGVLSRTYGVDLLASGIGALLGGALTFLLTPVEMVLVSVGLVLVNLWISFRFLRIPWPRTAVVSVIAVAVVGAELVAGVLSRLEAPKWLEEVTYSQWSRYRRIDVAESGSTMRVFTDGLLFQINYVDDRSHQDDPRQAATDLIRKSDRPVRDVLVIGSGTGTDVRIMKHVIGDHLNVVAVELDGGFVETARAFPWLWDSYRSAEIVVQEGRYFLENTGRNFDLVLFAYIDPQSAIGSIGVPDANFLYTDAGLRSAFARVRDGGALMITRVYLVEEEHAFIRRACATVRSAGIPPEHVRLYRRAASVPWGYYGQLTTLHLVAGKGGPPPELHARDLVLIPWTEGGRPTTDLFPFSLGTGMWFDALVGYTTRNAVVLFVCLATLGAVLASVATGVGRFTFFTLGFGSFLVESLVLFNSFLLFGDPSLSAAVAIGVFLLWNGLGSVLSERLERLRGWHLVVPALVLLYAVTAPLVSASTITTSPFVRLLIFTLHLAPAGIGCGAMFPIALRRFERESVAKMFFMDVVGCALAPPVFWIAMSLVGVSLVIGSALVSYAVVCLVLALRR